MGVAQMERLLHDARQYAAAVEERAAVDNERLTDAMLKAEQERDELASELKELKDLMRPPLPDFQHISVHMGRQETI